MAQPPREAGESQYNGIAFASSREEADRPARVLPNGRSKAPATHTRMPSPTGPSVVAITASHHADRRNIDAKKIPGTFSAEIHNPFAPQPQPQVVLRQVPGRDAEVVSVQQPVIQTEVKQIPGTEDKVVTHTWKV